MKEYALETTILGKKRYIAHTTKRDFDNKLIIETSTNPEEALTWPTKRKALEVLSTCILNDREFQVVTMDIEDQPEPKFSKQAESARIK